MQPLPIDEIIPRIVASLRRGASLVVEAPPGAGKTTRVPPRLLDESLAGAREVWVLEPRRLAARLAARRVADERGERLGETVGYQVRFDEVTGPRTRIRFVTEGVLTRRLLADPNLDRIGAVVLDEFHERHIHADVALALLRQLQRRARPDLTLVAMSATLDARPVADFLGCPQLRSEGKRYEVEIEHLSRPDDRPLAEQVASAVRRTVARGLDGDLLVFLPGAAEIRRSADACAAIAAEANLLVLPLHGELPASEQDRAVGRADRRKVILSTNVAESSVTIEGVVAVVDSGLARVAGYSPWSGLPTLRVARISKSAAAQRAGRAGRTGPGRCLRLYTANDFAARPEHDAPEVARVDLAETSLELHAAGIANLRSFEWFEAPPTDILESADSLLRRLGAVDASGAVTRLGREILSFPIHPRLARIVIAARDRGAARAGCLVAALAGERDIRARDSVAPPFARRSARTHGPSDLLELYDLFAEAQRGDSTGERFRRLGLDVAAVRSVDRVRRQLERIAGVGDEVGDARSLSTAEEAALLESVLAGFPDRVARRRTTDRGSANSGIVLASGGAAALAPESVVQRAEYLVAVDAEERRETGRRGGAVVRIASAIEVDWLIDLFPEQLRETTDIVWNPLEERAELVSRLLYDQLVLDERREVANGDAASALLAEAALAAPVDAFVHQDAVERFLARVEVVGKFMPEANLPHFGDEDVRDALVRLCDGLASFASLRAAASAGGVLNALRARLSARQAALLTSATPDRVAVNTRRVRIHYERGKLPWIASRLQDFFGLNDGPRIVEGRVPLVLHLLAPNNRPVQVTQDLAGFWERHYPAVRRELGRKYPRHAWPERPT